MFYAMDYSSPVGKLVMVADDNALLALWMERQKYFGRNMPEKIETRENTVLKTTALWLDAYFVKKCPDPKSLPLAPLGSGFSKLVWEILLGIPYGRVTTYGKIAKKIMQIKRLKSMSAQAVGGAVGHNPIGIIIPCHRVVGTNGTLTGYAGGLDKKEFLLRLEGVDTENVLQYQMD